MERPRAIKRQSNNYINHLLLHAALNTTQKTCLVLTEMILNHGD